jgi:oxalate decarboxylase/phosphoglucose isomerase-like protein (cupin superfamily)
MKLPFQLQSPICQVCPGAAHSWETDNSIVMSIAELTTKALAVACIPEWMTASIVRVSGPTVHPLHFHTSYVIGVVVHGLGTLHMRNEAGDDVEKEVRNGDIVYIPRGAFHVFSTEPGGSMDYVAFEFSDRPIDYQAHYTE